MTELIQSATCNQTIFVSNLIEMTKKDDKKFGKYIDENLFPKVSSLSIDAINENINALKEMEINQQLIVKARAKQFEESNDPSKYMPTLFGLFGIVFSLYALLGNLLGDSIWFNIFHGLVIAVIGLYGNRIFLNVIKIRPTAVYFNSLISNINYHKK